MSRQHSASVGDAHPLVGSAVLEAPHLVMLAFVGPRASGLGGSPGQGGATEPPGSLSAAAPPHLARQDGYQVSTFATQAHAQLELGEGHSPRAALHGGHDGLTPGGLRAERARFSRVVEGSERLSAASVESEALQAEKLPG